MFSHLHDGAVLAGSPGGGVTDQHSETVVLRSDVVKHLQQTAGIRPRREAKSRDGHVSASYIEKQVEYYYLLPIRLATLRAVVAARLDPWSMKHRAAVEKARYMSGCLLHEKILARENEKRLNDVLNVERDEAAVVRTAHCRDGGGDLHTTPTTARRTARRTTTTALSPQPQPSLPPPQ